MPRTKRIQLPHLLRHVVARGNGRMRIFTDDGDYRQFVYLLGDICERFAIECWSYCLMPNHYHAALWPTLPNLSEAMQRLNGEYAKWWNRTHGHVGHTFQGRFKAQIVQHDAYLFTLLRYIARNPVRAGLVEVPDLWRWGSYRALAGYEAAPPFLCASRVLPAFGETSLSEQQQRFAEHVLFDGTEDQALQDRLHSNEKVLGEAAFKQLVRLGSGAAPLDGGLEASVEDAERFATPI